MTYKVKVDKDKCIGCGACVSICPNVFEIGNDNKSHVKIKETEDECVNDAKDSCPVGAISVEKSN